MNISTLPENSLAKTKSNITSPTKLLKYRLMIAYRFLLAGVGGYLLASYSAMLIAKLFIDYRGSAAITATLIGFIVQASAFIWVFMINKTLKATLSIVLPLLLIYLLFKLQG